MTLTRRDFNIWAAKAPVNVTGAQRTALKLYRQVRPKLTAAEISSVGIAIDHALLGEGRSQFDKVAEQIRERLFGNQQPKQTKPEAWRGL